MELTIYFPRAHYSKTHRQYVFPLLKPFLKPNTFSDKDRKLMYGISEKDFKICEDINEANLVVLTMSWNYYVLTKQLKLAKDFIESATKKGKTIWIVNVLDSPLKFAYQKQCIIFELGVYASKLSAYQRVIPIFIKDPLKTYYNQTHIFKRSFNPNPTVGFCGLANGSLINRYVTLIKIAVRNFASFFGFRHLKSERLIAPSYLRYQILKTIKDSPIINDNFIIRSTYRAGVKTNQALHPSTLEFYDNIKHSDYILCVRGAGNFSVRLYETLAMGRIPIFINTDCVLPLANHIRWKDHVVWIEHNELHLLEEKLLHFHGQLDNHSLNALFENNRKLWESKLLLSNYFKYVQ